MNLTPNQFSVQLPSWYHKWATGNPKYFPLEKRLKQKAATMRFLEMADLVAITYVLGNPFNVRGKLQRENTNEEVKEKTSLAIQNLEDPIKALSAILDIRRWGRTYGSKTLRCICPEYYAALDSLLINNISPNYLQSKDELVRYIQFLTLCKQIQLKVPVSGPRQNGSWYIADIEIALFQFVWDGGKIV